DEDDDGHDGDDVRTFGRRWRRLLVSHKERMKSECFLQYTVNDTMSAYETGLLHRLLRRIRRPAPAHRPRHHRDRRRLAAAQGFRPLRPRAVVGPVVPDP